MDNPTPDTPSSDYEAMAPYWQKVTAILGGTEAMRKAGKKYLPKYDESEADYQARLRAARFTNIFDDIVEAVAARPFSKPVTVQDDMTPEPIKVLAEDIDARGNSLHTFAGEVFAAAISHGIDWILVDHTKGLPDGATVAQERAAGVRPYWVRYPAESVLAVYSAQVNGREEFTHVRLKEGIIERAGFGEVEKERVRVLNREKLADGTYAPATYEVWEERETKALDEEKWILIEGPTAISIGVIPMVPMITGRRLGGTWQLKPPMAAAADLQIELYEQENSLKNAKIMTAFPMLAANGIDPAIGDNGEPVSIRVSAKSVLYAPTNPNGGSAGSWAYVEPAATSLRFLADDIKETILQLRELGRQPLTAQSGNLTVVTTAFAAQKGNAAIQAWALNLADALEMALDFTAKWLKIEGYEPKVVIDTDFDLGLGDDESFTHVLALKQSEDISREATIHEAKRRGILDADYDGDADLEQILTEMDGGMDLPPDGLPPTV